MQWVMKSSTTVSSGILASIPQTALLSFSYKFGSSKIYASPSFITLIISSISQQCCGIRDTCRHSGLACIYTEYPLFFMLSANLQLLAFLHLNETMVESGSAINSKCSFYFINLLIFSTHSNNFLVHYINPYSPKSRKEPQAELKHPPFLDPKAVGEIQIPPGHVEKVKY